MTLDGLLCYQQPLDHLATEGIRCLKESSHAVIMLTGDLVRTAMAIGCSAGVLSGDTALVIDGATIDEQGDCDAILYRNHFPDMVACFNASRLEITRLVDAVAVSIKTTVPNWKDGHQRPAVQHSAEATTYADDVEAPETQETHYPRGEDLLRTVDLCVTGTLSEHAFSLSERSPSPFLAAARIFALLSPVDKAPIIQSLPVWPMRHDVWRWPYGYVGLLGC
jgi:magnesium-transporting ATPase (P-type)